MGRAREEAVVTMMISLSVKGGCVSPSMINVVL